MRYDNWDVILFTKDSAVPIQEFRTACHFLQDEQARQLPTLTCYVASLPAATPFRISMHSWVNPAKPSAFIESRRKDNQKVVYTIQVTIDGTRIYHGFFDVSSRWPQEIANEKRSFNEAHGSTQRHPSLEFPPFHQNILMQRSWSAGESNGRIKVLLSEQLLAADSDSGELQPAMSNDIVCFAFQHAPKDILEQFGISWPIHNPLYLASGSPQGPQVPITSAKARGPVIHPSMPQHSPSTFTKAHMQESFPRPGMKHPPQLSAFTNSIPVGRTFRSGLRNSSLTDSLPESYENMSTDSWSGKHLSSHSTVDTPQPSMMYASPAYGMPFNDWNFTGMPNVSKPSKSDGSKQPRQVVVTLREDQLGQLIEAISPPKGGRDRDATGQRPATGVHSKHTLSHLQTPTVSGRVVSRPSAAALARKASHQNNGIYTLRNNSPGKGHHMSHTSDKENRLQPSAQSHRVPTPHPFVVPQSQWEPDASMHRTSTLASDLSRDARKRPTSKESKGPSSVFTGIKSRKEGMRGSKASPIHIGRHDGSTLPTVDLTTNDQDEDESSCGMPPTKSAHDYLEDAVNGESIDKGTRSGHKDSISSMDSTDQLEQKLYSALGEELSFHTDAQPMRGMGDDVVTDGSLLGGFDTPIMKRKRRGSVGSEQECSPVSKMAKEDAEDAGQAGLGQSPEVPHLRGGV